MNAPEIDNTGATDVTDQVQAFLDGGGDLRTLPGGTYRLTKPLRLPRRSIDTSGKSLVWGSDEAAS